MFLAFPVNVTIRNPLLSVEVCAALAGQDRAGILDAITSGEVRYAFDLRTPAAGKPAVRVLATSLRDWMDGKSLPASTDTPAALQAVVADIFPPVGDDIRTANVARVLAISLHHVRELHRFQLIRATKESGPGKNNSALYSRRSLVQLLVSRRIT